MGNQCGGVKDDWSTHGFDTVGDVLDRAVSQSGHQISDCPLYELVNYQKGGLLIEVYSREGSSGLIRILQDPKIQGYIYEPDSVLTKREVNKWKRLQNRDVSISIDKKPDENIFKTDSMNVFKEHAACWKMHSRGMLGESLLHCMLICNSKIHSRIAMLTLIALPKLSLDVIEGDEFFGLSALHLCIIFNEIELLKKIVEAGAKVNQRATGKFFRPTDQRLNPKKETNYEGICYMGEYPLAWAASCGNEAAYNYLMKKGADPDLQDSYGNTVLHMTIVNNMKEMYGFALHHHVKPANNGILNNLGLAPLTLACKLGRNDIFRHMLEISSKEFWRYSNITCAGYSLNDLDSINPDGKINWNSALVIILNGRKEQHLDMLNGGVVQKLLEEKWKTFARTKFIKRLGLLIVHLIMLTLASCLRPSYSDPLLGPLDAKSVVRYCTEIMSCIGCLIYIFYQQGSEVVAQGFIGYFNNLASSPPKMIFVISNFLLVACIPVRIFGDRQIEDMLLAFVLPSSWFFLLFFAGAVRLTGPFMTMIYQMLTGDMLRFAIILSIFLLGFTQAFYFLFKKFPADHSFYIKYHETWMALLHMMLGEYEYPELDETIYSKLSKLVFVFYIILVTILLLNMLIAMMGNTYLQIITRSEKEWMKQWASIVLNLECSLDQTKAKENMLAYSFKFDQSDDQNGDDEQRAVLVIKSKSRSKAKQRKDALHNWKHFGKKIIKEVKKYGGTAELFFSHKAQEEEQLSAWWRKRSKNSRSSNEPYDSDGSTAAEKIESTVNKIAWANDLKIKLPRSFVKSEKEAESNKSDAQKSVLKSQNCDTSGPSNAMETSSNNTRKNGKKFNLKKSNKVGIMNDGNNIERSVNTTL